MESTSMTRKNWYNVFILGTGFLLLFSAFQTTAFVQVSDVGLGKNAACFSAQLSGCVLYAA